MFDRLFYNAPRDGGEGGQACFYHLNVPLELHENCLIRFLLHLLPVRMKISPILFQPNILIRTALSTEAKF